MNNFKAFDPLSAKSLATTEVAALAQKREIKNILSSYVGWYDPFGELIQNSLDSIEERSKTEGKEYEPTLWITVNIKDNSFLITDNGVGLDESKFKQFLCPDISFKSGKTRGHKGVGATYLAYGFNLIQVASKTPDFIAIGKMEGARKWLNDESPAGNPEMKPDSSGPKDSNFDSLDRGVSIYVKFDNTTHPKDLRWIVTDDATNWYKIFTIRTGLGSFTPSPNTKVNLTVIDRNGKETTFHKKSIEYFQIHEAVTKSVTYGEIVSKEHELFKRKGSGFEMPAKYKNLDSVYDNFTSADLLELEKNKKISLDDNEKEIIKRYTPRIYIVYLYSAKVWDAINKNLNARANMRVISSGIQIAANNMPQGELIQIPLNRNIGRQNQIHCLIHFDNCNPDLGRKGFQNEIVEFAKELSKKLADGPLLEVRKYLRANTGLSPNLTRQNAVDTWKNDMVTYESENPLELINSNFFLPTTKISITSKPSREQDVIALFNQLIAGGVIRGIKIMSTNERLTYDGLYRVIIEEPTEHHLYDEETNPLGIESSVLENYTLPILTSPKILEYKYSLDGLIEDIENGTKNSNDVGLIVVWETGEDYIHNYKITSFLDTDNLTLREYHGLTHCITNLNSGQREMEMIVLSELVDYLNNQDLTIAKQREKYED